MRQSYDDGSVFWECYVTGTIAFLGKNMATLKAATELLAKQDNQMNIEFLETYIKNFDKSYDEAYNND